MESSQKKRKVKMVKLSQQPMLNVSKREKKAPTKQKQFIKNQSKNSDEQSDEQSDYLHRPRRKRKKQNEQEVTPSDSYDDNILVDFLPEDDDQLQSLLTKVQKLKNQYKDQQIQKIINDQKTQSHAHADSIPITADVRTYDFSQLKQKQLKQGGRLFDIIAMDPPWKCFAANPARGVKLQYQCLDDYNIQQMPIETLSENGFIFIWAVNKKIPVAIKMMQKWGYKYVDSISWVKMTRVGQLCKANAYYLQHSKQSCLIGCKGEIDNRFNTVKLPDVIMSKLRKQSQKPDQIYEIIEQFCPQGFYLEIFGRRNNLRGKWVTIGNQI